MNSLAQGSLADKNWGILFGEKRQHFASVFVNHMIEKTGRDLAYLGLVGFESLISEIHAYIAFRN